VPVIPGRESLRFAERMTALEALMWRLEQLGPTHQSHMLLALALDRPVEPGALIARVESVAGRIPRLRQRIAASLLPGAPPWWQFDPGFDLGHHVRRWTPAGPAESASLTSVTEVLTTEPFDPEHPPWQVVVADRLADGTQGVVLKLHHSYTDGQGAIKLAGELFDLERWPPVSSPNGADEWAGSPRSTLLGDLADELSRAKDLVTSVVPWAGRTVRRALAEPEVFEAEARSLIADVQQMAYPGSHLLTGRSAASRLAWVEASLADMRRAASRAGGTVNDVFLAALLGGLSRYHDKHGPVPRSIRVGIPISTRSDGADMSNQLNAVVVRGPLRLTDADERVRLVHEIVLLGRQRPYLGILELAAEIGVRLPGAAEVAARLIGSLDLVASNVPGPPVELYLAGSRVERMMPVGPRSGAAINATLISYGDAVHVGVNADPAATPDFDVLVDCLTAGFDEIF
jgi:WS/DGAT/MGAT family acyltransferase